MESAMPQARRKAYLVIVTIVDPFDRAKRPCRGATFIWVFTKISMPKIEQAEIMSNIEKFFSKLPYIRDNYVVLAKSR